MRCSLLAACMWLALLSGDAAKAQNAARSTPGFTPVWIHAAVPLVSLSISPQGQYLAMITQDGRLALWQADTGESIWSIHGVTAHNAIVSDAIGYVLTYDSLNPLNRTVTLYRSQTPKASAKLQPNAVGPPSAPKPVVALKRTLDGAIWSADVSLDGSHAACGTGSRQVYIFSLDPHPSMASHPIDGICNDLNFAPNNQFLAAGLWNQSGVETLDMAGQNSLELPGVEHAPLQRGCLARQQKGARRFVLEPSFV